MPKIGCDGVEIYDGSRGSGPPLLPTRSYASTSAMWRGQIGPLSKHHKLVLWGMRGHGQPDHPSDGAAYREALTVFGHGRATWRVDAGSGIIGRISLWGVHVVDFILQRKARTEGCTMKISVAPVLLALALASPAAASTWQFPPTGTSYSSPFTRLPNTPLVFGMDVEDVSRILGQRLHYVSGGPGNEIYLAVRNTSSNRVFPRRDLLYLQFRKGRLTGWKGDAGYNWAWRW